MQITPTGLEGLYVLEPRVFEDDRGYFFESFNQQTLVANELVFDWVQDNEAFSSKGALRGLHYQLPSMAQTKLVRVITGSVLDVVVDIRPQSDTYGQHYSIVLSAENKKQFLVPRGFAHGYHVLEDSSIFAYKCDNYYSKEMEAGIAYNDPTLNIDWQLSSDVIVSQKDLEQPLFGQHKQYK